MTETASTILDIRAVLTAGGEPLPQIINAAAALGPKGQLRVLTNRNFTRLVAIMSSRGLMNRKRQIGEDTWEIIFKSKAAVPERGPERRCLDCRHLEVAQSRRRVLAALAGMSPGSTIEIYTAQEPAFVFQDAVLRGFAVESEWLACAGFRHIVRSVRRT